MNQGGIGFFGLLCLIFIVLKLTHVIDWSWGWVLLPFYGPLLLGIAFFIFMMVLFAKE